MKLWSDGIGHYNTCPGWYQLIPFGCSCKEERMKERNGSPIFYALLESMADIHNRKSHDYASNTNPYGNYQFAGMLSKLFDNPDDAGFVSRIGEKLYRIANMENSGKIPNNESIQDTEIDICTITVLWMASRRERRMKDCKDSRIDESFNPIA